MSDAGDALPVPEPASPADRLDSWKEIAAYLRRSARTVQRWERSEGLPVHRLGHEKLGSVYAYRSELDAWWEQRRIQLDGSPAVDDGSSPSGTSGSHRPSWLWPAAAVLLLAGLAVVSWAWRGREPGPTVAGGPVRLAILPFANLTGTADREFVSDGLTDEIIAELGRLPELGVIARSSVMRYKNRPTPAGEIGRELRVDYVLEGSVRETQSRVRVTVQLVRADDETHVWAESYDRELVDLLAIQSEVARQVALQIQLRVPARAEASSVPPAAHLAYLNGRFHWNRRTAEGFRQGIAHFLQALEHAPDYARAYSGLADSYLLMANYGYMAPSEALPRALEAAERAVALDDSLAEGHASLGNALYVHRWDFAGAEGEFRRALAINPNYASARLWFGIMLQNLGRFDEARVQFKAGLESDPLSGTLVGNLAYADFYEGQLDLALAAFRRASEREPQSAPAMIDLARALTQSGAHVEAVTLMRTAAELAGDHPMVQAVLAYVLARAGDLDEARDLLAHLEASPNVVDGHPDFLALVSVGLGDHEGTLRWLQRVYETKGVGALQLKVAPEYAPLRDDPRFVALVSAVGL